MAGGELPPTPSPRGNQAVPFQREIELAIRPPAFENTPPATTSPLGRTARARTTPAMPEPSQNQVLPFQIAIEFVIAPPATVKFPPATTSPFGRTASA